MKIYTKTGDKGTTALVGGQRVSKAHARLEAYGTLDELTAHIGFLHDLIGGMDEQQTQLQEVVSRVMDCAAIMAAEDLTIAKLPLITDQHIEQLELWSDQFTDKLPKIFKFTLPLGDKMVSYTHIARTVCRRAERSIVACNEDPNIDVSPQVMKYINRLSDYLYALSRHLASSNNCDEVLWR